MSNSNARGIGHISKTANYLFLHIKKNDMMAHKGNSDSPNGSAAKEIDILKIVKEDVLKILCERRKTTSLETIGDEIKVAHAIMSEALEELERDGLIAIQENYVLLTGLGQESAKGILEKHLVLENYLRKTGSKIEADTAANILEHYVSGEVINSISKLSTLKIEGVPLTKFGLNKEGMITDITFSDYKLFERIVSMGIFLGEKIMVTNEISHGVIVKVRNKKFALDKIIAEEIKVVEHERS